mmetsp:Transcript_108075/g.306450  ORF Transcript_108075/g.306450 Transcript_108075/m.306450 type:complete len:577 (-) Transcript_108075:46-1776(-)
MADGGEALSQEVSDWLLQLKLSAYKGSAQDWCFRNGVTRVEQILESRQDFAKALNLKPLEVKRVDKDYLSRAAPKPDGPAPVAAPTATPASPARPHAGSAQTIGPEGDLHKYIILEELGQGATATVYKCMRGETAMAVKTMSLAKLRLQKDFAHMKDKLNREIEILYALRHKKIVSLFEAIEQADKLHLVMELVEGGDLFDQIVKRGCFSEPTACYVFLQVAEGLQYIHSKGIVHRDLKPENILFDARASKGDQLEVKLTDFGQSKLIQDGYSVALTRVGTPQYWAPEVCDPAKALRGYDQRVDLWSLGVVLYVMLVGHYPFDGVSDTMENQIRRGSISFSGMAREISDQAKALVNGFIKVNPHERKSLADAFSDPWVVSQGGPKRLQKLCTEVGPSCHEESLKLPSNLTKDAPQLPKLRCDLLQWNKKFKCFARATYDQVIARYGPETHVEEARRELLQIVEFYFGACQRQPIAQAPHRVASPPLETIPEARRRKTFVLDLVVSDSAGAGLDLLPEHSGMRVLGICAQPGQPGMLVHDLIIKINEVSLQGQPDRVEDIFGANFGHGAQLVVLREA